ncbi:MAG: beta galactosidase jelly roll domain-containing protein [Chloroflexi bacterium]|nr:beta galactosidase jelly roll domain-containing protein [Chloroflexota bacterium]
MHEEYARTLTLLAPLTDARELDGEWRVKFADPDLAPEDAYCAPSFDDSTWEQVRLPHLRHATAERNRLWYRHHLKLQAPPSDHRTLLRFGSAFYETHVWLNGTKLGSHQGYFQPFGFDVSELLRAGENVMTVCCHFPVEAGRFKRKTAIAGIFTDWDCKPYPSTYYPHLPPPHEWTVPLGLWQPVYLQTTSDVLIESFNIFPTVHHPRWTEGADSAQVRMVLQLCNLAHVARNVHLEIDLAPHNFAGDSGARGEWDVALDGATSQSVEFSLDIAQPRLWFPWTHGTPHLYRAKLVLQCNDAAPRQVVQVFGVREIQAIADAQEWKWLLNGRRIFPKGSNYISDFYLDRVSVESLSRDLALVRGANLDLVRVHAHIGSHDFYRLCDEQGVMVMCDFPLIWTYAFNLPLEEQTAFRASVLQQVQDMIGLLGSHPSIILWSMHNEPPWTPDGSFLGSDVHASETNRQLDESAAEHTRALDPMRPVITASGQYDQHLYHGWYTGSWRDNRDLHPAFPTEFGVQALPNLDSPVWGTVNTNWPVDVEDPTWAHAGYQSIFWGSPGVGAPSQYASLAEYVKESQAYQAFYIRYTIDQWRRQKFAPVGGYIHFLFTDGWPAITWSVLDYGRLPKAGYHALAEVSRPAHVCVDLEEGYAVEGAFHLTYPIGGRFRANLYCVNDDYRLGGRTQLSWWLEPKRGWLRRWLRRWLAAPVVIELPRANERARLVQSLDLPLPRAGEYIFRTRLTQDGRVLDENRYDLRVGSALSERRISRHVPGFLVGRVYEFGSLRHTPDGFSFRLRNPVMLVLVQGLADLRVDGVPINPAQVEVIRGGLSRRASTITPQSPFEFPSGEHLTIVVREHSFSLGTHELEAVGRVLGLGEIGARWRDRLV